ncbi:MAG: GTP-binding protein [Candidatus Lokiarchaeota archaeon]|nr:GTP-binding protein [Candidatus Lokiarchaeota archaeon]MBD3200418.1 GTP-binding protein [Candidatus Lokiarchaeota archaeon]
MTEEEQPSYIFKICLLGQGAVGKTCIARRLCFDKFEMNTKLTIGIDFYTYNLPIQIDGEKSFVRLSIWDFGGQTQFRQLFTYYIHGANGIYMCFDLSNFQTLAGLEWWYDKLLKFGPTDCPRILIGTKNDLVNDMEIKKKNKLIIQRFMERHNEETFCRTSSKTNQNIMEIFKVLTTRILDFNNFEYDKIL